MVNSYLENKVHDLDRRIKRTDMVGKLLVGSLFFGGGALHYGTANNNDFSTYMGYGLLIAGCVGAISYQIFDSFKGKNPEL